MDVFKCGCICVLSRWELFDSIDVCSLECNELKSSKMFWLALETLNSEVLLGGRNWNITGVVILSLLITAAFTTLIVL